MHSNFLSDSIVLSLPALFREIDSFLYILLHNFSLYLLAIFNFKWRPNKMYYIASENKDSKRKDLPFRCTVTRRVISEDNIRKHIYEAFCLFLIHERVYFLL